MIGNLVSYGRKFANFNRPSLRITPSSSMQGLGFINWLFFGIGFPKLKAAYPSRKAWRCAKRTISSSAPFISSGCSSILAFLLSLSRMLCSTLLTLACTRTKRVQLEYRFGSSLHTHGVVLFRCSFFLKVTRHKGCTGIRLLFPLRVPYLWHFTRSIRDFHL